jgi:hypothetical protein
MQPLEISEQTARYFTKTVAGLQNTEYWYLQTLSFADAAHRENLPMAIQKLKKYLEWLVKAFPDSGILWVREFSRENFIHFHLLVLFYGERSQSPETFLKELRPRLFQMWDQLNGGGLSQRANMLTMPRYRADRIDKSFRYFIEPQKKPKTRKVLIVDKTDRPEFNWFGIRNGNVLKENSRPLTKQDISEAKFTLFRPKRAYNHRTPVEGN